MTVLMDARMKVAPKKRQELLRTLGGMKERMSLEPGFLRWRLSQDQDDENLLFLGIEWHSQDSLEKYLASSHHGVFLGALEILCEVPVITFQKITKLTI